MNTLIVILGPTGVGKTELSLQVAEHLGVPIINADSRQLFKELPIGTAAPTVAQRQRVKHYLTACKQLSDYYNASMFEEDVLTLLDKLFETHRFALMSGGSMMYIDAVCHGIDELPTVDDTTRTWMKQRLEEEGLSALAEELRKLDPEHYKEVDRNNPRRVVHALEICHITGKPYSSYRKNEKKQRPFRIVKIGLNREREVLYRRINERVLKMMKQGLVEEARRNFLYRHLNALNTVGYKELFEYFDGVTTLEEAVAKIQSATRRYCRKQLTWFKRDDTIRWFNPDDVEEIIKYIDELS